MMSSQQSKQGSFQSFQNSKSRKSPSQSSQSSTKKRRSKKFISSIPVLNIQGLNPQTYDLQKLMNSAIPSCSTPVIKSTSLLDKPCTISRFDSPRYLIHPTRNSQDCFSEASQNRLTQNLKVQQRFQRYLRSSLQKVEDQQKQKQEDELASCSFRPSINSESNLQRRRSLDQFYLDQVKHKKNFQKKLEEKRREQKKIKEEEQAKELSFKPIICAKSKKILSARTYSPLPCHQRLYKMHKSAAQHQILVNCLQKELEQGGSDQNQEIQNFTPKVNKRSKELVRKTPIQTRLYQDAKRRMRKSNQIQIPKKFQTSNHSIDILSNKILKEFQQAISKLDFNRQGKLNYLKFRNLFEKMRFVDTSRSSKCLELGLVLEIWNRLQQKEKVAVNDLKVSIMGLMGYFQSWMNSSSQKFRLNQNSAKLFHQKFKLLFQNRILAKSKPETTINYSQSSLKTRKSLFKKRRDQDTIPIQQIHEIAISQSISESISTSSIHSQTVDQLPLPISSHYPSLSKRHTMSLSDRVEVISSDTKKLQIFTTLRQNSYTPQNFPDFSTPSELKTATLLNLEFPQESHQFVVQPTEANVSSSPPSAINQSYYRRQKSHLLPQKKSGLSFRGLLFKNNG